MGWGRLVLAVLCAVWLAAVPAAAYDENVVAASTGLVEKLSLDLKTVEAGVTAPGVGDEQLTQFRAQVEDIRSRTSAALATLAGPVDEVNQQIKQLGPAPPEGKSEPESVAAQRKLLNDELSQLLGPKSQFDLIAVGAEQLSGRISSIQRDEFVKRIFESDRSILNPYLWYDTEVGLGVLNARISVLLETWWAESAQTANRKALALVPAYLLLFLAAFLFLRRVTMRWTRGQTFVTRTPDSIGRLWRIVRTLIVAFALVLVLFVPVYLAFENSGLMTPRFKLLFSAVVDTIVITLLNYVLARGLAAPGQPQWRVIDADEGAAARLPLLAGIAAFVSAGNDQLIKVADALYLPVNYTIGHSALAALLNLSLMSLIILTLKNQRGLQGDLAGRQFYFGWAGGFVPFVWLMIALGFVALLFGYLSFANYLAQHLLSTGLCLIVLFLLHHLSDAAVTESFNPQSGFGRFLRSLTGFGERGIERVGLIFRVVVDIVLFAVGLPVLFAVWTLTWIDFRNLANTVEAGLKIGSFTLAPSSVLTALLFLVSGIVLTNLLIRWLDRRILSETRIDKGVQDSLRKGASYAGYALAILTALSAGGVAFSNLAIVAGALGVGIGFGLQSVTNNFVSGLILLAERPIRVGDWVALDAGEGLVKRINVRSTEIESFDQCSIIVPNSSLINGVVRNWTHGDTMGRFLVTVTADLHSNAEQVRELLMDIAKAHKKVLTFPEPSVMLAKLGPVGLDFEVRAHVAEIFDGGPVASELRFEILRAFREKGITIPPPLAIIQAAHK